MRLSLAITTLLSVASAAAGIETSPGSLRGKKKSSSPSSKHSAADRHMPFNSTKKSSPLLAVVSEQWADDRPSKSKSKPEPERLAGSIVNKKQVKKGNRADDRPSKSKSKSKSKPERLAGSIVNKKQVEKGNSSRHLASQCINTPDWVDSYGDGCEWYETNDEPGCPSYGSDNDGGWDGGMGLPKDNCCHCQVAVTPYSIDDASDLGCSDTPEWVDSYGDGCEWYEANDEPGCPAEGSNWDGDMGLPKNNCCHCQVAVTPYSIDDASDLD